MDDLNLEQRRAVELINGPVVIKAGPGTGKTKTLVAKISYLLHSGVHPEAILALTFTKKAAKEIASRIKISESSSKKHLNVYTFHSFAYELLRQENDNVNIINNDQKRKILLGLQESAPDIKNISLRELELIISRAKNIETRNEKIQQLVDTYQRLIEAEGFIDFDDLLLKLINSLSDNATKLQQIQDKYRYVLVDEFQDTNFIQYKLIRMLTGKYRNITVIGDPLQSIYTFRGADSTIFDQFFNDYQEVEVVEFTVNYRSRKSILKTSTRLFPDSRELHSFKEGHPGVVALIETLDSYTEAAWIINKVEEKVGGSDLNKASDMAGNQDESARFKDFAILYRVHGINHVIEQKLRESGIPYQKVGAESMYDKKEINFIITLLKYYHSREDKDLLLVLSHPYLKLSRAVLGKIQRFYKNEGNLREMLLTIISQKNLTKSQIGKLRTIINNIEQIDSVIKESNVSAVVSFIVEKFNILESGNEQTELEIREFINNLGRFEDGPASLDAFLDYLTEIEAQDYYDDKVDKISLMSIHAAKGLEFKYVFIIGLEEGIIPYQKSIEENNIEEEKRLLYVGMTRAEDGLYLLYTQERWKEGYIKASSFKKFIEGKPLLEIQDEAIAKVKKARERYKAKKSQIRFGI